MRPAEEIDAEQFIAQKSFKAKGKRLTTWKIESIEELEPTRFPEPTGGEEEGSVDDSFKGTQSGGNDGNSSENATTELRENLDPDAGKSEQQVIDELTGQTSLFDDKRFTEENEKDKDWLKKQ